MDLVYNLIMASRALYNSTLFFFARVYSMNVYVIKNMCDVYTNGDFTYMA